MEGEAFSEVQAVGFEIVEARDSDRPRGSRHEQVVPAQLPPQVCSRGIPKLSATSRIEPGLPCSW